MGPVLLAWDNWPGCCQDGCWVAGFVWKDFGSTNIKLTEYFCHFIVLKILDYDVYWNVYDDR